MNFFHLKTQLIHYTPRVKAHRLDPSAGTVLFVNFKEEFLICDCFAETARHDVPL